VSAYRGGLFCEELFFGIFFIISSILFYSSKYITDRIRSSGEIEPIVAKSDKKSDTNTDDKCKHREPKEYK
jgi:hypothetical protein